MGSSSRPFSQTSLIIFGNSKWTDSDKNHPYENIQQFHQKLMVSNGFLCSGNSSWLVSLAASNGCFPRLPNQWFPTAFPKNLHLLFPISGIEPSRIHHGKSTSHGFSTGGWSSFVWQEEPRDPPESKCLGLLGVAVTICEPALNRWTGNDTGLTEGFGRDSSGNKSIEIFFFQIPAVFYEWLMSN